ncbi:MAG: hypothetical protein II956_13500 [Bacteroidales bacterium]|nr:hypothetical protein [Bacteroidales bacterium]
MVYFKHNIKRKKSSILKYALYAAVLVALLFFFIPKYLVYKAGTIFSKEIPEGVTISEIPPSKQMMTAYNYLQVAKFFPAGEEDGLKGQKFILDYYYPLFKKDYETMKFLCVDNAITFLKGIDSVNKDSVNVMALKNYWKKQPDNQAVKEFKAKWEIYHKNFSKELKDYYRF